jgi:hypothetical protein
MWSKRMAAFLRGKGQILWDVTVDNGYVQPMNYLAPGSRDMFDTNNKAVDYLFRALCQPEFNRVHTDHLACRIWSVLNEAHVGAADLTLREDAREPGELKEELKGVFHVRKGRTLFHRVSKGEQPRQAQVQGQEEEVQEEGSWTWEEDTVSRKDEEIERHRV